MGLVREEILDALDASVSEAELQRCILQLATACGWTTYHTYDSRRSNAGYPDLTLVRPPRLMFVELKSEKGKWRPMQEKWLELLRACNVEAYAWRPHDWRDGTIEAVLRND